MKCYDDRVIVRITKEKVRKAPWCIFVAFVEGIFPPKMEETLFEAVFLRAIWRRKMTVQNSPSLCSGSAQNPV